MKKLNLLVFCLVVVLTVSTAFAGERSGQFNEFDRDRDGYITWEEYRYYYPYTDREVFKRAIQGERGFTRENWRTYRDRYGYYYEDYYYVSPEVLDRDRNRYISWEEFRYYYPYARYDYWRELSAGERAIDYKLWRATKGRKGKVRYYDQVEGAFK